MITRRTFFKLAGALGAAAVTPLALPEADMVASVGRGSLRLLDNMGMTLHVKFISDETAFRYVNWQLVPESEWDDIKGESQLRHGSPFVKLGERA